MASNIVPDTIDDAYPVAGQDNDSQGFRDNFNIIKTNFTYAKQDIEDLQDNTAKTNGENNFFENTLSRYVTRQESIVSGQKTIDNNDATERVLSFATAHHWEVTITGSDATIELEDWPATEHYAEMTMAITSQTGDPYVVTFNSKQNSGVGTQYYFVDDNTEFGGARQITTATNTTTVKKVKAYTYDNGANVFLEYVGTFTRIAP